MTTPTSLLEAVSAVARIAGDVAHEFYGTGAHVESKTDGSPVTVADRQAEQAARHWIEARYPEDGILGEEFGAIRPGAKRRWLLDPVDGTRTFIRHVPLWGTLIAVAEGERVLAGAAYFPALGELVAAERGMGCWWNGTRCAVSPCADLTRAAVVTTDARFAVHPERREQWMKLSRNSELCRTWGDCYGYLLIATGRAEVMADDVLSPWDAAPVSVIVEEAGGVFTDWAGRPTAFGGGAIATNGRLAAAVRDILIGPGHGMKG
jgi:histidinol-phosphatase